MAYEAESEVIQGEFEDELEGEFEDEYEDESGLEGEGWLGAIGNVVGSLLGEGEGEDEFEDESSYEFEAEEEISPIRKVYPDAMMEHLGELAAESESEDEAAEHFLPLIGMAASKLLPIVAKAVIPMAKKALPKIARAVTRATPRLTKGVGQIAKTLHRNPQTRHLLKTVPTIARRTVKTIARQAARGGRVTPQTAVRTLGRQARHVLVNPRHRKHALRRHNRLEHTFHRRYARGMARPHWRYGHRYGAGGSPATYAGGAPPTGVHTHGPGGQTVQYGSTARYGQMVGGRCVCPSCGAGHTATTTATPAPATTTVAAAPAPSYCRCCGQVLR